VGPDVSGGEAGERVLGEGEWGKQGSDLAQRRIVWRPGPALKAGLHCFV
jgi:hypothetical protein